MSLGDERPKRGVGPAKHGGVAASPSLAVDTQPRNRSGFLTEARRHVRAVDVLVLTVVPAVLALVFSLPVALRRTLALAYADPTPLTAFASHFVHLDVGHLASNLAVYGLVVPVAFLLCAFAGRKREFYVAFTTFLLAFPILLSALNVALARPRLGYGFSGVNTAFFGLLPIALCWYASRGRSVPSLHDRSPTLFFACTALVAVVAVPPSLPSLSIAIVGVAATGAYARDALESIPRLAAFRRDVVTTWQTRPGYVELGVFGIGAVVLFPVIAFPADPASGGTVLNVYTHLLGYALGFIASYVTFGLVGVDEGT